LQKASNDGLAIVTEVMSDRDVDLVAKYADVMQVARGTCRISCC